MSNTTRRLGSALAAITIAGSTLLGGSSAVQAGVPLPVPSLLNAPVPASCSHPATTLDGYEKDYPESNGHTTLDAASAVYGHLGNHAGNVTVVPLSCSERGATWPELLLVYGPGRTLLGKVQLRKEIGGQAHGEAYHLSVDDLGLVWMDVTTSNRDGFLRTKYRSTLSWRHDRPTFRLGLPQTIDLAPDGDDTEAPAIRGPRQSSRLKPAPAGLRTFLQRQRDKVGTYAKLERYRHRTGGVALVDWDPGDEEAKVAGKVDGRWQWLATYWDRGQERPSCGDLTGNALNAWEGLGLTCDDHGQAITLGHWPGQSARPSRRAPADAFS